MYRISAFVFHLLQWYLSIQNDFFSFGVITEAQFTHHCCCFLCKNYEKFKNKSFSNDLQKQISGCSLYVCKHQRWSFCHGTLLMFLEKPAEIPNHCERYSTELHLVFPFSTWQSSRMLLFFSDRVQRVDFLVLICFLITWTGLCILHYLTLLNWINIIETHYLVFQMVTSVKMKTIYGITFTWFLSMSISQKNKL